jgi:hypothetical protein
MWRRGVYLGDTHPRVEVPVQYFQSVIAIELAVAGALLWQIRFFESSATTREQTHLPDSRLRLAVALVLGATVFGCCGRRYGQDVDSSDARPR